MPLTFAHPAAILPFSRKSRYINFSALVLGSMAPDFEYFLRGQPLGEFGHTFMGFLFFNLPLVTLVYFIYHNFIHQTLFNHLPILLQDTNTMNKDYNKKLKGLVFCYSALFGMLTHVVWDSFTHIDGYLVVKFPILAHIYSIYGFKVPLYKILQHSSTLFGIIMIMVYLSYRALTRRNQKEIEVDPKRKFIFWSSTFLLTILSVLIWYILDYVSILSYGIMVVRMIDSFLISIFIISLLVMLFS